MKVVRGFTKLIIALSVMLVSSFSCSMAANAESAPDYRIQVSPTMLELDLKPGQVSKANFKVQNTGTKEFEFELDVAPYSVTDENYTQNITTTSNYTQIKDWVIFSKDSGTIPAGGEEEITVKVNVPQDVPAGGQYAAILARMKEPTNTEGGIKSEKQIGILLYSKNVDGQTREEGKIAENKVPSFLFAPPIQATSVVENTGNVHADAKYVLQVFPLFGDEEVYTTEESPATRTVLPETRRFNRVTWDGAPQLGIFKVRQTVEFLGEKSVTEKVVFLCPIWFLLIILVLVFLAVFWIVSRSRGRKED